MGQILPTENKLIIRLDSRLFPLAGQHLFAKLSGDYNPMHVDPVQARRTLFGHAVVHGVHGLMWALDCFLLQKNLPKASIQSLRVQFRKSIAAGHEAVVNLVEETGDRFNLAIESGGETVTLVQGSWGPSFNDLPCPGPIEAGQCMEWQIENAAATVGALPLNIDVELLGQLFPALAQCLPIVQSAELLATTRLVGMVCPGLRSLYVGLDLKAAGSGGACELNYGIKRSNPRLGSVDLAVTGPTLQGLLSTFVRPSPQPQPSMAEVREALGGMTFSGQRAVVVGGSRGIGEVTAKCIAAGGGSVVITYMSGAEDAQKVVDEIKSAGGQAYAISLDCLQLSSQFIEQLAPLGSPTHLYYFATPSIPVNPKRSFSTADFRKMAQYYVEGFVGLVLAMHPASNGNLTVLYPSTIFLDQPEPGTGEYCAAKAAGETVCAHLGKVLPGTRFLTPRLPRMRTDQTVGILPGKSLEPLAVIAELLKQVL